MKYTYARKIVTRDGEETFIAKDCASFDEAQKYVEKGIYDRRLQLGAHPQPGVVKGPIVGPSTTAAPAAIPPAPTGGTSGVVI